MEFRGHFYFGLTCLFLALTSFGLYQIAKTRWGVLPAMLAFGFWVYGVHKVGPYQHLGDSNFTETYSLLFNVAAVFFWIKTFHSDTGYGYYFLIGVMAGLSFMLRPNNIGIELCIALAELIKYTMQKKFREGVKKIVFLSIGGMVVVLFFVLLFFYYSALAEFFDSFIVYNLTYSYQGRSIAFRLVDIFVRSFSEFGWIPFLGYFSILARFFYDKFFAKKDFANEIFTYFLLLVLPVEVLLSSISGRVLLHYYIIWIPCMAWLVGGLLVVVFPSITNITEKFEKLFLTALPVVLLVALLMFTTPAVHKYWEIANNLLYRKDHAAVKIDAIVRYLNNTTLPNDTVLVWGNVVWMNFLSNRRSPTKYIFQYPLFLSGYTNEEKVLSFLSDLQRNPPVVIVEPKVDLSEMLPINILYKGKVSSGIKLPDGMDKVFNFIDTNYCIVAITHDVIIYRINSDLQGAVCQ